MPTASTSNGAASSSTTTVIPPSPTLYVKNLASSIKKPELRQQLYTLFSSYGRVLDVVATRAPGMRGQAFIVFESVSLSSAAKRALDGFVFYGNAIKIDYSRGEKSKALLKSEVGQQAVLQAQLETSKTTSNKRSNQDHDHESKRIKLDSTVISAQNIPQSIDQSILETLFASKTGFIKLEPTHHDSTWSASIHFDTPHNAHTAKTALHGVQLDPTYTLTLTVL